MRLKISSLICLLIVSSVFVCANDFRKIFSVINVISYADKDAKLHLILNDESFNGDYIIDMDRIIKSLDYNTSDFHSFIFIDKKSKLNNVKYKSSYDDLVFKYSIENVLLKSFEICSPGIAMVFNTATYICKIYRTNSGDFIGAEGKIEFVKNDQKKIFLFYGAAIVGIFEIGDCLYVATQGFGSENLFELYGLQNKP